jgi:hypothetical protein
MKQTISDDEKLIPVAGGMSVRPEMATGTLTRVSQVLGKRRARSQVMTGRTAPASSQ